jgi:hypothetical protein
MQNQSIQFVATSPQQLQREISESVKNHLDDFLKHFKPEPPKEYLTRNDVAKMFSVDISTVHNWSKNGRLKPLALSGRIYYLRSDVEASLKPLTV